MAKRLYRLLISSSTNADLVRVEQIAARDIDWAEQRAARSLARLRAGHKGGTAWDQWDLGVKAPGGGGWLHIARGGPQGTTWTVRDTLDRLRTHGGG